MQLLKLSDASELEKGVTKVTHFRTGERSNQGNTLQNWRKE
jgi:hypothetical protein